MQRLMVEWELTLKCNYSCNYCGLLRPIQEITDEKMLYDFIEDINTKYPSTEIFLFGGEPFLHPKIEFILKTLQSFNQPFVIQSNLSNTSTKIIEALDVEPYKLNISVHVSQTSLDDIKNNIMKINPTEIHLMYTENTGKVEKYYKILNIIKNKSRLVLTPISNLACSGFDNILEKYNTIKYKYNHDTNTVMYNSKDILRSDIWLMQNKSTISLTKNKPCLYMDKYILFTPSLEQMNCCYRKNHKGICNEQNCFFM